MRNLLEYLPQGLAHCKLSVNLGSSQWTGQGGGSHFLCGILYGLSNWMDPRNFHVVGRIGGKGLGEDSTPEPAFLPSLQLLVSLIHPQNSPWPG